MAELKPGWQRVRFGDVIRLNKETCKDPEAEGIERVIGLEHLEPGDLRVRSWGDVADGTTFINRARPGQVLFGKRRAYQRKIAVADCDAVCSGDIYVFESADPKRLLPELLPFICQTRAFFEHAVGTSAGSLSPRTNWKSLAEYKFALPPLEEQGAILAVLQSALKTHEAIEDATCKAEKAVEALREEHIAACRAEYPLKPIHALSTLVTKGESPRWQGYDYCDEGVRFVTSENVLDGRLSLFPGKFLPLEFDDKLQRSQLKTGDILVNIVGGSIGRICAVPPGIGRANINQAVALVRPDPALLFPGYLLSVLLASTTKHALCSRKVDDYKPNLSLTAIRDFQVSLPTLHAQEAHVASVQSITACISSLNARAQRTQSLLSDLLSHSLPGSM